MENTRAVILTALVLRLLGTISICIIALKNICHKYLYNSFANWYNQTRA